MASDLPTIGDDDWMRGLHGLPSDMVMMDASAAIAGQFFEMQVHRDLNREGEG